MADLKVLLRQACKTESEWISSDPIIPKNVMAISSDKSYRFKIGDGVKKWSALSYNAANASDVYSWAKASTKPSYSKSEIGLGNVPNVTTNDQTPTYTDTTSLLTLTSGEKISVAFAKIKLAITNLINHINNKSNPHNVTKSQIGLGNVDNTADSTKNVLSATKLTTARSINGVSFNGTTNITLNTMYAEKLSNKTINLDSLNLSEGYPNIKWYYCPTDGEGANITGRPDDGVKQAFSLKCELIRFASSSDYITKQTYVQGSTKVTWERFCVKGTWSDWGKVYTSQSKPKPADIGAATTNHSHNLASTSASGYLRQLTGSTSQFMRADGTWATPPNTTYSKATTSALGLIMIGYTENGKNYPVELDTNGKAFVNVPWTDNNTTYGIASTTSNGLMSSTDKLKLDNIASGANKYTHPSYTQRTSGLYKISVDSIGHVNSVEQVTKSDITELGIPGSDTNTWIAFKGASSSNSGTAGYIPAPSAGNSNRYFRSDGTWAVPPNTTYSNMTGASSSANGKAGLVPAPSAGNSNRYLRSDGTWAVPPNTTYSLSTFGITATATELNYVDGVTSNVQTQLNNKSPKVHSHVISQSTEPTGQNIGDIWFKEE